jgi:hypothetical protein
MVYFFLRLTLSKPKAANGDTISASEAISGATSVLLLKLVNLSRVLSTHSVSARDIYRFFARCRLLAVACLDYDYYAGDP